MLRDLVWLEEEEKEAWCGCEVQLRGWGVDQVGTLRWSGLGPAGLWGPLLPRRSHSGWWWGLRLAARVTVRGAAPQLVCCLRRGLGPSQQEEE